MKAIVYEKYGPPEDVLELKEVEKPTPKDDEALVRVHAASVVYGDLALVRGKPFVARLSSGLLKPKYKIPGIDMAGRVEAVGTNVKQFQPGDEVFGDLFESGFGAFAEKVCARENALALKPANMTFEEAAAVPQAALVALQALRDSGQIQPGQKVLINGASGGNGTFAVQIAKSFGAEVTGVCSTRNLDLVRSIGADHVIDYTQEDFTQSEQRYDLVLDIVANRSVSDYMRALKPEGVYAAVAFNPSGLFLGPLISMTGSKKVVQFSHKPSVEDLLFMKELLEADKVVPVIDRRYPLSQTAEALRYYGEGHPRGKVVITVEHNDKI
jgi:NADPH:quinone reductase-like Zn-dependent oxidoreductase